MKCRWIVAFVALTIVTLVFVGEGFSSQDKVRDTLPKRWLVYSTHAMERMAQRKITEKQVSRTVAAGKVNPVKSDPPKTYSVELYDEGRWIRVVLAPHLWFFATVVTVIDLNS